MKAIIFFPKIAFPFLLCICACGRKNIYAGTAPIALEEKAEMDMEAGLSDSSRFESAEQKLKIVLEKEPQNYAARTLLAASQAAQGHLIMVNILLNSATSGAAINSDPQSSLDFFSTIFPEATDTNIAHIKDAVDSLSLIPDASLETEMIFQKSVFLSAYSYLSLKKLLARIQVGGAVTDTDVTDLLSIIDTAKTALGGDNNPIGKALGILATGIENSNGASPSEKLASWAQIISQ